jgi:hypothetical protein
MARAPGSSIGVLTLAAHPGRARLTYYRDPDFTAEVYTRADGDRRSVAQAGGIV